MGVFVGAGVGVSVGTGECVMADTFRRVTPLAAFQCHLPSKWPLVAYRLLFAMLQSLVEGTLVSLVLLVTTKW